MLQELTGELETLMSGSILEADAVFPLVGPCFHQVPLEPNHPYFNVNPKV